MAYYKKVPAQSTINSSLKLLEVWRIYITQSMLFHPPPHPPAPIKLWFCVHFSLSRGQPDNRRSRDCVLFVLMTPLNAWLSIVGQPTICILFYVSFVVEQQQDAFGRSFSLFFVNPISISHPAQKERRRRRKRKKERRELWGFRVRSRQIRYAESACPGRILQKGHLLSLSFFSNTMRL